MATYRMGLKHTDVLAAMRGITTTTGDTKLERNKQKSF